MMGKGRLEAFSDGVIAVIITIMVLELKPPHGIEPQVLLEDYPAFLAYVLSFVVVGVVWVSHHHLLHAVEKVSGSLLWANMNLLFWVSLIPFTTAWMGESHFAPWPVFIYSLNAFLATSSYALLTWTAVWDHGPQSRMAKAVGKNGKSILTIAVYLAAMATALFSPMLACVFLIAGPAIWFIPDRRFENR